MAKSSITLHATVHYAWWWPLYIHGLIAVCRITRMWPDMEKVMAVHERAYKVRFVK